MATSIDYTTFAAAVGQTDRRVQLASASAAVAGRLIVARNSAGLIEAMSIIRVDGVFCDVKRGQNSSVAQGFESGVQAFIGASDRFAGTVPKGVGSATAEPYLPRIVIPDHRIFCLDGTKWVEILPEPGRRIYRQRFRVAVADVNAGYTLLAALPGFRYRLTDAYAISVGGAAAAVTTVDLIGTVTSARKLVAWAQANLTQSALLRAGGTGATILADGASFTQNDANTAITVGITGSSITTATHIDFSVEYSIEP